MLDDMLYVYEDWGIWVYPPWIKEESHMIDWGKKGYGIPVSNEANVLGAESGGLG